MKIYSLKNEFREILKKPLGLSFEGSSEKIKEEYDSFLKKNSFAKIVTVGDNTSLSLFSHVKIFDKKTKRDPIVNTLDYDFSFENLPGTINEEAFEIIQKALKENKNIFVTGEEDLLLIPTVLLSSENTLVVYGLPNQGISLIVVTLEIKKTFEKILREGFEIQEKKA